MRKIDEHISNKLANISFVCSVMIVCIYTTIECENTGSFFVFFNKFLPRFSRLMFGGRE